MTIKACCVSSMDQFNGPMFKPNTFVLQHEGTELAKVLKKWSGIARETFTAADNFHVGLNT